MPGLPLTARFQLPRFIERNVAQTLTLDVYDAAGAQQTATAGWFTLRRGSTDIVAREVIDTPGAPSSHAITAAETDGEALGDNYLEVWELTIGGVDYTFRRTAYLVRHALYPVLTEQDVLDRHEDLARELPSALTSTEAYRDAAWGKVNRRLITQGRRPELVLDSWALWDYHLAETLYLVATDLMTGAAGSRWTELRDHYAEEKETAWAGLEFRYDSDEDGDADDDERVSATSVLMTNLPPTAEPWRRGQ